MQGIRCCVGQPGTEWRVALRYSLLFFPICIGFAMPGPEWSFAVASAPVNVWLVKEAVRFWKLEGTRGVREACFGLACGISLWL